MSKVNLQLRFDGPELIGHAMDVRLLGPSLFSLGELFTEANHVLNGEDVKVKVLIKADVKANCVTLDFNVIQTVYHAIETVVRNEHVSTALEICEWIGIIAGPPVAGWRLIQYLRHKKGKKEESSSITQGDNGNIVVIKLEGDNNTINLSPEVHKLSKNTRIVEAIKTIIEPVSEANGINEATFIEGKNQLKIDTKFAADLQEAYADDVEAEPQIFTAHLVIYAVTLDPKSKHWKFKFGGRVESVDIGATSIATDAMKRGGVTVGDTYKSKVEMIERKTKNGDYKTSYKIKEVLQFSPGTQTVQTWMPFTPKNDNQNE